MKATTTPSSAHSPILFFDGVCGLCNGVVDWLMPRTTNWKFAPLQGSTAQEMLPQSLTQTLDTVVVWKDGKFYTHSKAVIEILQTMPTYRWIARIMSAVPNGIRNVGYLGVANVRYLIFGKREMCRLPSPAERARFLP